MKKMLGTLIACLLMAGGMTVLAASPAGAHTPSGGADCTKGVWAKGTNYSSTNTNTLTVSVDGTVKTLAFTVNGDLSLPIPQDGVQHSWSWKVDTTNSNPAYKASGSGKITCGTPPDTSSQSITFCHATSSETNPYNLITTNVHAFYTAGHVNHAGDIFPAGSYTKNGQTFSWPAQGNLSLLQYPECVKPTPPPPAPRDASVTLTITPPTCTTPGSASYRTVRAHLIGTFLTGPGSHVAAFEVDLGHLFNDGTSVIERSYDVAPILTGNACKPPVVVPPTPVPPKTVPPTPVPPVPPTPVPPVVPPVPPTPPVKPKHTVTHVSVTDICNCYRDKVKMTGKHVTIRSSHPKPTVWRFVVTAKKGFMIPSKIGGHSGWAKQQVYVVHTTDKVCPCVKNHTCHAEHPHFVPPVHHCRGRCS